MRLEPGRWPSTGSLSPTCRYALDDVCRFPFSIATRELLFQNVLDVLSLMLTVFFQRVPPFVFFVRFHRTLLCSQMTLICSHVFFYRPYLSWCECRFPFSNCYSLIALPKYARCSFADVDRVSWKFLSFGSLKLISTPLCTVRFLRRC